MGELYYVVKGALIGFILSAPVGPVEIFCIKKTLNRGRLHGYAVGLGAAVGDGLYALIAVFGLSFIIHFLVDHSCMLRLIGGAFLMGMGLYLTLCKRKTSKKVQEMESVGHLGQTFGQAVLFDLSNPLVLLAYIAIFSGFGLSNVNRNVFSSISLVVGVIAGALTWWFLLVQCVAIFKKKIHKEGLKVMNRISGLLVILFGGFVILTALFHISIFGKSF